jgi:hypothetical protein
MGEATYADLRAGLQEALAEERFNAVVVGEFKRGKTTSSTHSSGPEVLPAAVVPLTSIVTAVTWGDRPRGEVHPATEVAATVPLLVS